LSLYLVVRDDIDATPMERALDFHDPEWEVALYLINHGCGGDEEKAKLLCKACDCGEIDVVEELVEKHSIDPNGNYIT